MTDSKKGYWLLILAAFAVPLVPWLLLGPWLEPFFATLFSKAEILQAHPWSSAGLGVLVLTADSLLPVPSTLVMSALGLASGLALGGLASALGLFLSGSLCYLACRRYGQGAARRLAGEKALSRISQIMQDRGPFMVAITRAVPLFQEACACMAGLTSMQAGRFFAALAAGCLPTGFIYAAIGAGATHNQGLAFLLSIALPAASWLLLWFWHTRRSP